MRNCRTVEVDADRIAEIHGSYSGDRIVEKTIRKPFKFEGDLYVCTGGFSRACPPEHEETCYKLVRRSDFTGEAAWYGEALENVPVSSEEARWGHGWAEQRRSQPEGFYHGMLVKRGGSEWVLVGPCIVFTQKEGTVVTKQLTLF